MNPHVIRAERKKRLVLWRSIDGVAMRWFKHMTATRRDERVARLIAEHGYLSYGHYWAVLEAVAEQMDGSERCSVTYPVTAWSQLLSVRGSHVRSALSKLQVTGLVTVEWNGSDITVTIPNLLKYRDEYSRKSGVAPDKLPRQSNGQSQITNPDDQVNGDRPFKGLADALQIDATRIPNRNRTTFNYIAKCWEEAGKPSEDQDMAPFLDVRIDWCKENHDLYPSILLRRLKEIKARLNGCLSER